MAQKLKEESFMGQRYGRLTVIGVNSVLPIIITTTGRQNGWKYMLQCKCDCGNECIVSYKDLRRKHCVSCGCYKKEITIQRNKTMLASRNGETVGKYKRLYRIYRGMKERCYNPKCKEYKHYGAREIEISPIWLGEDGYQNFKRWSIENSYNDLMEIERVNNDDNYSPTNCKWATRKDQMNNTRKTLWIKYKGKEQSLSQWCEELNLSYSTTLARINKLGFTPEEALECDKYTVLHKNIHNSKQIVLDGFVFNSIKECCEKYLNMTTGRFGKYLSGKEPMPKQWIERGLRYYSMEESHLPIWIQNNKGEDKC